MYKLYFDGSRKDDHIKYGYVLYDSTGNRVAKNVGTVFDRDLSNNAAEYLGLMTGLFHARILGVTEIEVYGDSQSIIEQSRKSRIKKNKMRSFHKIVRDLVISFSVCNLIWIDRKYNKEADRLLR